MHVIYFNDTQKPQVPIVDVVIEAIISANLKKAVKIAFVDDPECLVGLPFKTWSDDFDGVLSRIFVPHRIYQVWREIVVDKLSPGLPDQKLLVAIVEIKLQVEVRWE